MMDGRGRAMMLIQAYWVEQNKYEEGEPSVWGWWNRMAEYLFSFSRRFYHA